MPSKRDNRHLLRGLIVIVILISSVVCALCWWQLWRVDDYRDGLSAVAVADSKLAPLQSNLQHLAQPQARGSLLAIDDSTPALADAIAAIAPRSTSIDQHWALLRQSLNKIGRSEKDLAAFDRVWTALRDRLGEAMSYLPELDPNNPLHASVSQALLALDGEVDRWQPLRGDNADIRQNLALFITRAQALKDTDAATHAIRAVASRLAQTQEALSTVVSLYQVQQSDVDAATARSAELKSALSAHADKLSDLQKQSDHIRLTAMTALVVLLIAAPLLLFVIFMDERRRRLYHQNKNQRDQSAIMALLDDLSKLADGDLTVHADVDEALTGALADAFNYAVDELATLVSTLNKGTLSVQQAVKRGRGAAGKMLEVGERQRRVIQGAASAVETISKRASESQTLASTAASQAVESLEKAEQQSNEIVQKQSQSEAVGLALNEANRYLSEVDFSVEAMANALTTVETLVERCAILSLNAGLQADKTGQQALADLALEVDALSALFRDVSADLFNRLSDVQRDAAMSQERLGEGVAYFDGQAEHIDGAKSQVDSVRSVLIDIGRAVNMQLGLLDAQRQDTDELLDQVSALQNAGVQTIKVARDTAYEVARLSQVAQQWQRSTEHFKLPQNHDQ